MLQEVNIRLKILHKFFEINRPQEGNNAQVEDWGQEELSLAISQQVASTLQRMKSDLDGKSLSADLGEVDGATEDSAVALLQEHMSALSHSWRQASSTKQVRVYHYQDTLALLVMNRRVGSV